MKKKKVQGFLARTIFCVSCILASVFPAPVFADDSLRIEYGTVYLNNYVGDALDLSKLSSFQVRVEFSGTNQIITTGEFGLRAAADTLIFSPADDTASLEIIVNSATSQANGILNTAGSIDFNEQSHIKISVSSALPAEAVSTSEVTAISAAKNFGVFRDSSFDLSNPTGNYTVFAQNYWFMGVPNADFFHATHKITNGVGDAFYGNDFEEVTWLCSEDGDCSRTVEISMPDFTFSHLRTDTLGDFRFLTSIFDGVSISLDTSPINTANLATPELFAAEEARLKASLSVSESAADQPFAIDFDQSYLVQDGEDLFMHLEFISTDPFQGFLHQSHGPYSCLFLNGNYDEPIYPDSGQRVRYDSGYRETFNLPLATFTLEEPEPIQPVDPTPPNPSPLIIAELPEDPLPDITIIAAPVVPKTPDTSVPVSSCAHSAVLATFSVVLLSLYTIFVIKLTYG